MHDMRHGVLEIRISGLSVGIERDVVDQVMCVAVGPRVVIRPDKRVGIPLGA